MEDGLGNLLRLHTIQDGEAIEPYYFCFTCNITSHLPGPCRCCQQEFEFKERPPTGLGKSGPPGGASRRHRW